MATTFLHGSKMFRTSFWRMLRDSSLQTRSKHSQNLLISLPPKRDKLSEFGRNVRCYVSDFQYLEIPQHSPFLVSNKACWVISERLHAHRFFWTLEQSFFDYKSTFIRNNFCSLIHFFFKQKKWYKNSKFTVLERVLVLASGCQGCVLVLEQSTCTNSHYVLSSNCWSCSQEHFGISTFCRSQAVPGNNLGVLTRLLYFFL